MMKKMIACMLTALLLSLCALASAETVSTPIPGLDSLSSFDLYSSNAKTALVSEPGWTLVSPSTAGAKKAIIRGVETADFDASFTTMLDSSGRVKVGLIFRGSDFSSGQNGHSGYLCLLERKVRDGVNNPITLVLHKYGKDADGVTDKHLGVMAADVTAPADDPLGGDLHEGAELRFTAKVEGNTFTAKVCLADGTELYALTADLTAEGASEAKLGVSYQYERGAIGFYLTNDGGNRPNSKIKDISVSCHGTDVVYLLPPSATSGVSLGKAQASQAETKPLDQLSSYDLFASASGEIVQEGEYFTTATAGNKKAILQDYSADDFGASVNVKIDPNANLKAAIVFRAQQAGDGPNELEGYMCTVQRIVGKERVDIIFYKYGMANDQLTYLGELGRLVQEGKGSIVGDMVPGLSNQELTLHLQVEGNQATAYYTLVDQPEKASGTLTANLDKKTNKETGEEAIYYAEGALGLYLGQVNAKTPITQQLWDFKLELPIKRTSLGGTVGLAGLSLSDLGIANDWHNIVPVDLTHNAYYTHTLVGADAHIIGKAIIAVKNGTVAVQCIYADGDISEKGQCLKWYTSLNDITAADLASREGGFTCNDVVSVADDLGGAEVAYLSINNEVSWLSPVTSSGGTLPRYWRNTQAWIAYREELKALIPAE